MSWYNENKGCIDDSLTSENLKKSFLNSCAGQRRTKSARELMRVVKREFV